MRNFIIYIALLLLYSACNYQAQTLPDKGLCGHRGASSSQPENTIASISEAVRLGAQMIEFDVRATKDNQLIIMHNSSVDETTNGKGKVKDLTLSEIKKLDAGSWKGERFTGEKVPTLEEVLDIIPDTILMNIHIKEGVATAEAAAVLLTQRNQINNAVLAFDNESAKAVRKINSNIKICCMERGNTTEEYFDNALAVNADFIQLTEREFPVLLQSVKFLKKHNIKINFFYSDSIDKLKILFDAGVNFVLVNELSKLIKEAKETGVL